MRIHPLPLLPLSFVLATALTLWSCGAPTENHGTRENSVATGGSSVDEQEPLATTGGASENGSTAEAPPARPPCDTPTLPLYEDGQRVGDACPRDLAADGLTALDLSDGWTPYIFSESDLGGRQPYRPIFTALADEQLRRVPEGYDEEQYLELFGIFPTFRVLLDRLGDEARHSCHAEIDDQWLERQENTIRAWRPRPPQQRRQVRQARALRRRLEEAAEREGLASIEALENHPRHGDTYARYLTAQTPVGAVAAAQAHLRCDGLLNTRRRIREGVLGAWTANGLRDFQRLHMVVSAGFLDGETRRALAEDSREADFRSLLRSLRERVISSTGLIEDGSAGHAWQQVLGRDLDAPQFQFEAGHRAAANPAPDHIAAATEAAARALGWTDPQEALAALRALRDDQVQTVAVRLPPLPAYHSEHMNLRAEIDRGDIWYHYPYRSDGRAIGGRVDQRPIVTLYVEHEGQEIALVRWPTTIGGWKPETRPDGTVGLRYKNSPTGERVWRDVIASPTWLPPPSTPDDELVRRTREGYEARRSIFGPGYRSAYGLVMMMHHLVQPSRREGGEPRFIDEGIRVHGSVSYRSITRGTSHGCHRLYNHLAVRLASFVLSHRRHERSGRVPAAYRREVIIYDEEVDEEVGPLQPGTIQAAERPVEARVDVEIDTRGYRFELTPPVPINVLEGEVHGRRQQPLEAFHPLPEELVERVQAEAAEDG